MLTGRVDQPGNLGVGQVDVRTARFAGELPSRIGFAASCRSETASSRIAASTP